VCVVIACREVSFKKKESDSKESLSVSCCYLLQRPLYFTRSQPLPLFGGAWAEPRRRVRLPRSAPLRDFKTPYLSCGFDFDPTKCCRSRPRHSSSACPTS